MKNQFSIGKILFRNALLGVLLTLAACAPEDHGSTTINRGDYRTVVSISDCQAEKYSYRCRVKTTLGTYPSLEIHRIPGVMMSEGDILLYDGGNSKSEVLTMMCRTGSCNPYGSCYVWMPCYSKHQF